MEVSAADPLASMQAIENDELAGIVKEIGARLEKIIKKL